MGILTKIRGLVRFGTVHKIDNSTKRQKVQVSMLAGEVAEIPRFQSYGFSSIPVEPDIDGKSAEAVIVAPSGESSTRVAVVVDDRRYRPTVGAEGDVMLFTHKDTPSATHASATHRIAFDTRSGVKTIIRCATTGDSTITTDGAGTATIDASQSITFSVGSSSITITGSKITIDADAVDIVTSLLDVKS